MDIQFNYKAAIRGYESVVLTRTWNDIGNLNLVINSEITNADLIQLDDIIWFDNEYNKAFIIEKIETTLAGSAKIYNIKASHLNTLLKDFITIPATGDDYDVVSGTREQIVRSWVQKNCIAPDELSRVQYQVLLGEIQGLGDTITEQTRFKVLSEEIIRILSTEDLGWVLELDITNQSFVFKVCKGIDRTTTQNSNGRVLFGLKYGNISEYKKVEDSSPQKNVAYVGGQGEGVTRNIVKVEILGTRKKEIFVDARDANTTEELRERGLQTLSETGAVNTYEFETLDRQFVYEKDYEIGDFVTIIIDKNDYQHLQIQKVKEIYEQGNISIVPEFGKPERTIGKVISSVAKKLEALEGASLKLDDVNITENATWSSAKINITVEDLAALDTRVDTLELNNNRVQLINNTGATSIKGKLVRSGATQDSSVILTPIGAPDTIGVLAEDGILQGQPVWVIYSGAADVYFSGSTTRGHFARSCIATDAGATAGQAISEAIPASPFATDKHFCEIGHVLQSRTGAGLAKCILHFN